MNDTRELAKELTESKRLTHYQARVLLDQTDEPLILDLYEILECVDRGGMGVVYKALHRSMDRIVALKTLPPEAVDSEEKIRRFQREVKSSAKLIHPNIVTTYDARQVEGRHFLVMEYIDGRNLLLRVAAEVAASVGSACHEEGDAVSGVLGAMGLTTAQARGAVRLSMGHPTTRSEIEHVAAALVSAWHKRQSDP